MTVLKKMPSLADILQIEDNPELVEVLCPVTGLPVWPQIRVAYLRAILSDLVYEVELTGKSQTRVPATRACSTLIRSTAHNLLHTWRKPSHSPICIFGDGVGNQLVDGKWFNRLAGHFISERPEQTMVVEDHFEWRWHFPRHHNNVLMHAPWQAANRIAGRLKAGEREHRLARRLLDLVNQRAEHHLQWSPGALRDAGFVAMAAQKIAALPYQVATYSRLLDRIGPKVLFVNAASYGPAAGLLAAAKHKGIVTAEFQHGVISRGHDAYNFGPAVLVSERYRHTLPDFLLTYGDWWGEQTNAPVRKITIGNPLRSARIPAAPPVEKKDLLVLSDGLQIDRYLELMGSIAREAVQVGLRPVLRPHPLERTKLAALPGELTEGFEVDTNPDIYESLRKARVLVGEASTGLFEAVGVADQIFMWATKRADFVFSEYPFPSFTKVEELAAMLRDQHSGSRYSVKPTDIWADDWARHYQNFLTSQGVEACAVK